LWWGVFDHLNFFEFVSALLVEGDISLTAVQDSLVRSHALADRGERLDNPQPKLLPLHALINGNILDMSDGAEAANELALEEDSANTNERVRGAINDDDGEIRLGRWGVRLGRVELGEVLLVASVWCLSEHRKELEVTAVIVGRRKWSKVKLLRQDLLDRLGDEIGGEEEVELSVGGERRHGGRLVDYRDAHRDQRAHGSVQDYLELQSS